MRLTSTKHHQLCQTASWQSGNGGHGGGWHKTQLWFTANATISILFFLKLRSIYSVLFSAEYPVLDKTSEVVDYLRLSRNVFLNEFQIVLWKSKEVESCFNRKSKELYWFWWRQICWVILRIRIKMINWDKPLDVFHINPNQARRKRCHAGGGPVGILEAGLCSWTLSSLKSHAEWRSGVGRQDPKLFRGELPLLLLV